VGYAGVVVENGALVDDETAASGGDPIAREPVTTQWSTRTSAADVISHSEAAARRVEVEIANRPFSCVPAILADEKTDQATT
jgi:hypothetical protein